MSDPLADHSALPPVSTERLRLRALRPSDAPAIFAIFSDATVTQYWGHGQMQAMEEARAFIADTEEGFRTRELLEWGITWADADDVIGTGAFAGWDQEHRRAEIGFALRRDCWGQGLMTEVLPALLAFGFETLNLHRIEADVDPRNAASIRLLERVGFKREGHLRERYLNDGDAQDALFYGLLRHEAPFLARSAR